MVSDVFNVGLFSLFDGKNLARCHEVLSPRFFLIQSIVFTIDISQLGAKLGINTIKISITTMIVIYIITFKF